MAIGVSLAALLVANSLVAADEMDISVGAEASSYQTGSGIVGSPIAFSIDRRQYIAVPTSCSGWATWGGKGGAPYLKGNRKGGYLAVIALFK